MTDLPPVRRAARNSSAALAAALSFLLPGLGQAYAGRLGLGLLFAAPVLLLIGMTGGALVIGAQTLLDALVVPGTLAAIVALDLALMVWRLIAIGHAGLGRPATRSDASGPMADPRRSTATVLFVAVLMAVTIGTHLWVAQTAVAAEDALAHIFEPGSKGPVVDPAFGHLDPSLPEYAWDGTERLNLLLIGYDSGPGRVDDLTDTILVVSIDPVGKSAFMVSIPRDTGYAPLPDRRVYADGVFPGRINELASDANANPDLWCPDLQQGEDCGLRMLRQSVGLYVGLDINNVGWVDLQGFAALVDAMGGVDLCLPGTLADPEYGGPTWENQVGIVLEAGCQHYDGAHALAFARIRKGTMTLSDGTVEIQNDFLRAERQQEFLLAVQKRLASANLLITLPGLLSAVSDTVTTDFPRSQAGNLASLAPLIGDGNIQRVVLGWPGYVDLPVDPLNYYLLIPIREAVRAEMAGLLGVEALSGWYLGSDAAGPP
jgi:LCP family protein required for cell wall assembly